MKKLQKNKGYSRFYWFPVEESLPRNHSKVIVSILMRNKEGEEYYIREFSSYCQISNTNPNELGWFIPKNIKQHPDFVRVLAWMYAPPIYKPPILAIVNDNTP
jgi:hypothetical protein